MPSCTESYSLKFFHDKEREFSPDYAHKFLSNSDSNINNNTINLGYTPGNVWILAQLHDESTMETVPNCLIEFQNPQLDEITSFSLAGGTLRKTNVVGDTFNFNKRTIAHRNFVLKLDKSTLYRLRSGATMTVPIGIYSPLEFIPTSEKDTLILGIFYGVMFLIFFYGIVSFLIMHNFGFLIYSGFAFFTLWFFLEKDGITYQYFWPSFTEWQSKGVRLVSYISSIFGMLSYQFFLRESIPLKLHKIATIYISSSILSFVATLLLPAYLTPLLTICLTITGTLLMTLLSVSAYKNKNPMAIYFLISSTIYVCGLVLYSLSVTNKVPKMIITEYPMQISCTIDFILLTIVLNKKTLAIYADKNRFEYIYHLRRRVVHDIKQFIEITGDFFSKLLSDSPDDLEFANNTMNRKLVEDQFNNMAKLIEEFNVIGKAQSPLKIERINICEILETEVSKFGGKYKVEYSFGYQGYIKADRLACKRIFTNILANAHRYVCKKNNGKVWIRTRNSSNGSVEICIGNNNSHISEHIKNRIFLDSFSFNDKKNRTSGFGRQGLGLFNAKMLVEAQGGKIWFKSNNKLNFVEFYVTLPIQERGIEKSANYRQ